MLIAPGKGGNRLIAVNAQAEAAGLKPGMLLTDATAIAPEVKAASHNARDEAAHLRRLALWCRRYSPWAAPDAPNGVWLDITRGAHLFGGEATLLRDIRKRFQGAGFACRAAIASTHATAWGMTRYAPSPLAIVAEGEEKKRLSPLPIRALCVAETKAAVLDRLGLRTIGQLFAVPRAQLRARFGDDLCARLDQVLSLKGEGLTALAYEPVYFQKLDFNEPVTSLEALLVAAGLLIEPIAARLRGDGKGARDFTFTLFDTQGDCVDVSLALTQPSHRAEHILSLLRERFAALQGRFRGDLAFDAATLLANRVEKLSAVQTHLAAEITAKTAHEDALAQFLDRLRARLGEAAVTRFAFRESHIPERALIAAPIFSNAMTSASAQAATPRPFLLLPRPEEIDILAELPDYPPRRFTWRRLHHRVVKAEGPERIEPEWWSGKGQTGTARDYYTVEDAEGRRFWLYREGLYAPEAAKPRWYLHGLFP